MSLLLAAAIPAQADAGSFVLDPGFEAGTPNPAWEESSTNFGTPLCDLGSCPLGGGTGPNTGSWWAWFGGIIGVREEGSVRQTVTLPPAQGATLRFMLENTTCSGERADTLEVLVDGTRVFAIFGDDPNCGVLGYREVSVDISGATGQTVDLEFHSIVEGEGFEVTNFFVDDIDIELTGVSDFDFQITGTCPGTTRLIADGGTPNASVGLVFSNSLGGTPLGAGPCAGTPSGLADPSLFIITTLDADGALVLERAAPEGVCGLFLQLVDSEAGCVLSNVTRVPE